MQGAHTCLLTARFEDSLLLVRLILQKCVLSTVGTLPWSLPSPRFTLYLGEVSVLCSHVLVHCCFLGF